MPGTALALFANPTIGSQDPGMALDEAAWAEIVRLYVEGDETVAEIADRFGLRPKDIAARVKARGLPLRRFNWRPPSGRRAGRRPPAPTPASARAVAATRRKTAKASPPVVAGDATRNARDALISRLYRALEKKIRHLEDRMDTTDGTDPAISEQQTRELNAAVSAFEKVTEVHTDADKARAAVERTVSISSRADLERLRRDLAERLHRLWGEKEP